MLDINQLSEKDKGRWVEFKSYFGADRGRIKNWNDKYVFVVYERPGRDMTLYQQYTAIATRPQDLNFVDKGDSVEHR